MSIRAKISLILCLLTWCNMVSGLATLATSMKYKARSHLNFHAHVDRLQSLQAATEDPEKTGYFRLPESSSGESSQNPLNTESYDEVYDEIERSVQIDNPTTERLYRQLLFAFDNYQESEVKQMTAMILKMPFQLSKLLQLMRIAEDIESIAEKNGGFDEYMYDALRTVRSQIRMYGKDAELGEDYQAALRKGRFIWPWEKA